jgi:hypothetical protein
VKTEEDYKELLELSNQKKLETILKTKPICNQS